MLKLSFLFAVRYETNNGYAIAQKNSLANIRNNAAFCFVVFSFAAFVWTQLICLHSPLCLV